MSSPGNSLSAYFFPPLPTTNDLLKLLYDEAVNVLILYSHSGTCLQKWEWFDRNPFKNYMAGGTTCEHWSNGTQ